MSANRIATACPGDDAPKFPHEGQPFKFFREMRDLIKIGQAADDSSIDNDVKQNLLYQVDYLIDEWNQMPALERSHRQTRFLVELGNAGFFGPEVGAMLRPTVPPE